MPVCNGKVKQTHLRGELRQSSWLIGKVVMCRVVTHTCVHLSQLSCLASVAEY